MSCLIEEPHSYSNFTAQARKSKHHKSDRADTSHVIQGNLFHMNTFVEFQKKQIKFRIFEGRVMLLAYRPCAVDESEVNAQENWRQEVHLRRRAFDHHDTLET